MTISQTTENLNITDATLRSPDAYTQMMHRCYGRVYLTALAMVRQPEMAEDIAQETFLRAWLKRDSVRDPALLLQPWLIRIARNLSVDWLRTGQQRSRVLPLISLEDITVEPADHTAPTPRQAAGQAELNAQVTDAVMALPDELRQPVLLHFVEGMSASDIARMNGEAPSTVTRRLDRARDLLRQHMESGLTAGLATLKPGPRSLEKALALFAAAVVLPAATQANVLAVVSDTPTPPLIEPDNHLHSSSAIKDAGLAGKVGLTKGLAIAAATLTAAVIVGGGAIMVQSARNNASDSGSDSVSRTETKVAALDPIAGREYASASRANSSKTLLGRFSNAEKRNLTISESAFSGNSTTSIPATGATRTVAGSAATSDSEVFVSGIVYDEGTSEALAGVMVQLLDDNILKHSTTSTAEGRYAFTGVASSGEWMLNASLHGYMALPVPGYTSRNGHPSIPIRIPNGSKAIEKAVPMVPSVSISGQITDSAGRGVVGAPLIWRGTREFTPDDYVATTSTVNGSFTFSTLPFQQGFVDVSAQGFAFFRSHELNLADRDLSDLSFSLEPGATVRGTVTNKAGAPVPGATLSVQDHYSLGTGWRFDNRKVASTDSTGAFSIGSLIPGNRTVRVYADGYAPDYFHPELAVGQHQDSVEVVLDEGLTIEGRVVGTEGEPTTAHINIGGMTHTMGEGMGSRPVQKTLSDGSFILRGFSSGTVTLSVISHNPERNKQVTVQAGDKDVLVKMDGELAMHAVVVDSKTKRPVENFTVTGVGEHFKKGEPTGGFRFFIEPGHTMFPRINAEGYVTETFEVVAPKGVAEANATLEIGVGAAVSGRVVSAVTREPVAEVAVAAFDSTSFGDTPLGTSVTDKDGRFVIANLPGNKLKIKAMPPQPMAHETVTVETIDDEITDAGDIAVSAGGRIFGKVVSSGSGAPPKNVQVFFSGPEGANFTWTWTPLPPSGTFNYPGLKPGKYKVGANASTYKIDLKPGEEREVVVTLGQVEMRGTISLNGETTETGIRARNLATGQISAGRQNPPKGYIMTNLQPGPHEITLINSRFDEAPPVHSEVYDVPNQDMVQKDFVVP